MPIARRTLGRTGAQVTILGLGGVCWNLKDSDREAVEVVLHAIDRGITYLDTASGYKESERRLGLALKERDRSALFIATKCVQRQGDAARRELADSFARLQVEVIDLVQLHALDQEESPQKVLAEDGVLRLIEEYRQAGKIRFVGLTGHTYPARFIGLLQEGAISGGQRPAAASPSGPAPGAIQYDFDTILNPVGPVNRVWNDFTQTSLAAARARRMGTIGMKVMAYGQVPPEDRAAYLRFALGQNVDVAIVGMDTVEQVEENVRVAEAFAPLSAREEREVLDRALALVPRVRQKLWWLPEQRQAS
ncbi:MAG: aldo/keto reductase [Candidatus Latescibacterota bacterium]